VKRRAAIKNRITAKRRRLRVGKSDGLVDSPIFKSLVGLIPVLVMMVIASLNLFPVNDELRKEQHRTGQFPYSTLAHWDLARESAKRFDYTVAEKEYRLGEKYMSKDSPVLGASSEIEDLIWPETKLLEEVRGLSGVDVAPRSRSLLLKLAIDYWSLGESELAKEALEKAARIDPNDSSVSRTERLLNEER